jgi:hypothetical protein
MLGTRTPQMRPRAGGLEVRPPRQADAAPLFRLWEPVHVRCEVAAKRSMRRAQTVDHFLLARSEDLLSQYCKNAGTSRPDKLAEEKKG